MAKTLLLLAEGFEEIEALTAADLLRRAGIACTTAALGGELAVTGAHGVTVLADESVPLGESFTLLGRRDRSMRNRLDMPALTADLDRSRYSILLDHQPNDYANEAAAGVDLVLSGHTHGGHVLPAHLVDRIFHFNDRRYGTEVRGSTRFVVTSGISGWAIPFKTGCFSEYAVIDIVPTA